MSFFDASGGFTDGQLEAKRLKVGPIEVDALGDITGVANINGSPVGGGIGPQNLDAVVTGLGAVPPFIGTLSTILAKASAGVWKAFHFEGASVIAGANLFFDIANRFLAIRVHDLINPGVTFSQVQVGTEASMSTTVAGQTETIITAGTANVDLTSMTNQVNFQAGTSINATALTEINLQSVGGNIIANAAAGSLQFTSAQSVGIESTTAGANITAASDIQLNATGGFADINAGSNITATATNGNINLNAVAPGGVIALTTAQSLVECNNSGVLLKFDDIAPVAERSKIDVQSLQISAVKTVAAAIVSDLNLYDASANFSHYTGPMLIQGATTTLLKNYPTDDKVSITAAGVQIVTDGGGSIIFPNTMVPSGGNGNYVWPSAPGAAGDRLTLDLNGVLRWAP